MSSLYHVFYPGDNCGWIERSAKFTYATGPTADYRPGKNPIGVSGAHGGARYSVKVATGTNDVAVITIKASLGELYSLLLYVIYYDIL